MDVGDYYSKSFNDFKENLNIAIPSLVGIILTFVIMAVAVLIAIFGFLGPQAFINGMITPESVPNISITAVLIFTVIIFIAVIISIVINSFIYAATLGMAEKIVEGQKPGLDVAWKKGKKYFIKILAVIIISGVLALILTIPFFLGLLLLTVYYILGLVVTILGVLILIVGAVGLALGLLLVNQSIVIGKKSIIDSIKDSIKVFMKNKLQVFLVAIINLAVAMGIGLVLSLIPVLGSFLNAIVGIILTPYFALVVTYLYMDVKEKLPIPEY